MTVSTLHGFSTARANVFVREGNWYYETKILHGNEGISALLDNFQTTTKIDTGTQDSDSAKERKEAAVRVLQYPILLPVAKALHLLPEIQRTQSLRSLLGTCVLGWLVVKPVYKRLWGLTATATGYGTLPANAFT